MATNKKQTKTHNDYHIAVFFSLEIEMSAFRHMLDNEHTRLRSKKGDPNRYVLGDLHGHNVALVCLPGVQGNIEMASMAKEVDLSFTCIKWRFIVGIGAGVPSAKHDIRLGDVVVSMPEAVHPGVVRFDLGKEHEDCFTLKGHLMAAPAALRSAANMMKSDHRIEDNCISEFIAEMIVKKPRLSCYARPYTDPQTSEETMELAATNPLPGNPLREKTGTREEMNDRPPEIHYGLIASGSRVIASAKKRDALVRDLGDVLCFETGAAGLMTQYPCIAIRGVSNYADGRENNDWDYHAAATAAACLKELLLHVDNEEISDIPAASIFQAMGTQNTGSATLNVGGILSFCKDSSGVPAPLLRLTHWTAAPVPTDESAVQPSIPASS